MSVGPPGNKDPTVMLQRIRDRITGKFALAILALIALPFVFFGINYNFIGLGYAAKVDGEEISVPEFENAYRLQILDLQEQGVEVPAELRAMLREGVLDRLIQRRLLDLYVVEAGYQVSDEMVTAFIQRNPAFQADGAFSMDTYQQTLAMQAIDPAVYEAGQRQNLRELQLLRGVARSAFVTPSEYRRYLNLFAEQREVSIAEIDIVSIAESLDVSDDDIQAYYDERPDAFQSPESVDLAYVELNRLTLAAELEITEDDLRAYYDASSSRYLQDEQRQARHILIPFGDDDDAAEQEATALSARASAGEPFEDLARQYSKDGGTATRGGDLGLLMQTQLPGALGDAVFSMEEGDIRGPVRTTFGFHVIRLDQIVQGGPLPFEQVRAELERDLQLDKVEASYQSAERELSDALFDAADLSALAATVGLELKTSTGYTRSGGGAFGTNQSAIDAVFDDRMLVDREISDIVELDANRSVVIAVTDYHEAARRPLEEVRGAIESSIRQERSFEIANGRVTELETALRAGSEFGEAAAAVDGATTRTLTVTRQSADVDPRIQQAVFQQKKPAPGAPRIGTVVTSDQKYAVYSVTGYAPGRPESIPLAERDAGKIRLSEVSGERDFASMLEDLERRATIVKSEDVLAAETNFE